jgi:hypothetical protein
MPVLQCRCSSQSGETVLRPLRRTMRRVFMHATPCQQNQAECDGHGVLREWAQTLRVNFFDASFARPCISCMHCTQGELRPRVCEESARAPQRHSVCSAFAYSRRLGVVNTVTTFAAGGISSGRCRETRQKRSNRLITRMLLASSPPTFLRLQRCLTCFLSSLSIVPSWPRH